jgi:hypothetical protein
MTIAEVEAATPPAQDGVYGDISEPVYHGDLDSLSSSGARALLKSPAKFDYGRTHPKHAAHFDLGHYVHGLVLGVGEPVVIIDAKDYKTTKAQDARDEAYTEGKVPILVGVAEVGKAMAKRITEHDTAGSLLANPERASELSAYWHDDETSVRCRARFDVVAPVGDWLVLGDVKTTSVSADPDDFGKTAANHGLYIQRSWYVAAAVACGMAPIEAIDFVFINVETEPPHEVSMTRLKPRAIALGDKKMRQAIRLFADCTANNHWPSYGSGIHDVDLPNYIYYQEDNNE